MRTGSAARVPAVLISMSAPKLPVSFLCTCMSSFLLHTIIHPRKRVCLYAPVGELPLVGVPPFCFRQASTLTSVKPKDTLTKMQPLRFYEIAFGKSATILKMAYFSQNARILNPIQQPKHIARLHNVQES